MAEDEFDSKFEEFLVSFYNHYAPEKADKVDLDAIYEKFKKGKEADIVYKLVKKYKKQGSIEKREKGKSPFADLMKGMDMGKGMDGLDGLDGLGKDDKDNSIKITNQLSEKLLPETEVVEWYNKPSTKRKLQEATYDILDSHGISEDNIEELSEKILSILNRENV